MPAPTLEKKSSSKKKDINPEEFRKLPLEERARLLNDSVLPNNITEEEIIKMCRESRKRVSQKRQQELQHCR
jgi:hypothetical protein